MFTQLYFWRVKLSICPSLPSQLDPCNIFSSSLFCLALLKLEKCKIYLALKKSFVMEVVIFVWDQMQFKQGKTKTIFFSYYFIYITYIFTPFQTIHIYLVALAECDWLFPLLLYWVRYTSLLSQLFQKST